MGDLAEWDMRSVMITTMGEMGEEMGSRVIEGEYGEVILGNGGWG